MKLGGVYLTFNGDCHKAMTFYSKVFGKKIDMAMTWADGKDGGMLPKEMQDSKVDDANPNAPPSSGKYVDLPYAPFGRSDRLGRAA